jgi:ornithine carbamoyltransferase
LLYDLLTLAERWSLPGGRLIDSLKGRKLAFYGDCASNMAHSWILGGALTGMEIVLSGPESFAPHAFVEERLRAAGLSPTYAFNPDPEEAARDADAVYTDVWVSMGTEDEQVKRLALMAPYQVNAAVMERASPEAYFLHCLPAHPGEEVSQEVYGSAASIVFDQAENRLHAQKAILSHLVKS